MFSIEQNDLKYLKIRKKNTQRIFVKSFLIV